MEKVKLSLKKYWKKFVAAIVAITLLLAGIFIGGPIIFPPTPPTGGTAQTSFTSLTGDGYQRCASAVYGTAYDNDTASGGWGVTGVNGIQGGRRNAVGTYYVFRSFLPFDTSTLGAYKNVTAIILSLNITVLVVTSQAFSITVYSVETYAHPDFTNLTDSAWWGEYNYTNYDSCTLIGSLASTSVTLNAYNNITLTGTAFVNKTTTTKLILRTDKEFTNASIATLTSNKGEYWNANANESALGPPLLYVSYDTPYSDSYGTDVAYAGYNVTFYSHWTGVAGSDFTGCYGNFTSNETGTFILTTVALSSAWCNVSRVTPYTVGTVVQYNFTANDTAARIGVIGPINLTLTTAMYSIAYENDDVIYNSTSPYQYLTGNIQIGNSTQTDLLDSYSESSYTAPYSLWVSGGTPISRAGQSFTMISEARTLTSCKFYLKRVGTCDGWVRAGLYAHSGTYGTSSEPTGTAVAYSDYVNSLTGITTSCSLITFTFSTPYVMAADTYYCITFELAAGSWSSTDYIDIGTDTTPADSGNAFIYYSADWDGNNTRDICYYVYGSYINIANTTMRWENLFATRYSTIDNCTIQFQSNTTVASAVIWVRIYGVAWDNHTKTWSSPVFPFVYPLTTAYVDWQLPNTTAGSLYSTPNLASVVQEIVARDGWQHSNAWAIRILYLNGTGIREFTGYNGYCSNAYLEWNALPEYTSYDVDSVEVSGETITWSYKWYYWWYSGGMSKFCYQTNNTATETNSSWTAVSSGDAYVCWTNFSFQISPTNPWIVTLKVYVNATDTLDSYVASRNMRPLYYGFNSSVLGIMDYNTNLLGLGLTHTTGRKVFHDNNTNSFVGVYSNGTDMCYAFSPDGFTWQNRTAIRGAIIADHFYITIEPHSGYTYLHYIFGYEGYSDAPQDCRIWYRRGNITYSDPTYSIMWQTAEQLVYNTTGHNGPLPLSMDQNDTYPEGIVVDYSGYVYLVVNNGSNTAWYTHDNITVRLWRNDNLDGTWSTTSGFPKNITVTDLGLWECSPVVLSDDTIAVMMASGEAGSPEVNFYGNVSVWFWNGTDLWYEYATTLDTYFRDSGTAVVDEYDQIHITYHASDATIRYARRTAAGVWDRTEDLVWDQDISASGTTTAMWTVPQIAYDQANNRIFVNWLGNDGYLYIAYKYTTSETWAEFPFRILNITGTTLPNVCIEKTVANSLLFVSEAPGTPNILYSYYYDLVSVISDTDLVYGWNNFTAKIVDVGHTLGDMSDSLALDSVGWSVITIDYLNTTQVSMIYGTSFNSEYQITVGAKLWIYCTDAEITWTHTYG